MENPRRCPEQKLGAPKRSHPSAKLNSPVRETLRPEADKAFSRTSGAPLRLGNRVRLLENADGNYPAWLEAIASATRVVYLENYIFADDEVGRRFAEALAERARAGVQVRVIRDWMGSRPVSSHAFWARLTAAGVEHRCFNPPRLDSPFAWLSRDHRKMIAVDGRIAFVAGLCISRRWEGDPARSVAPWRDTGVEIVGPGVADVEAAFAETWASIGDPLPSGEIARAEEVPPAGDVALRVVAGAPSTSGLFRMDQLVSALARKSLWLTDAYFVGVVPYVQALRSAAVDGVDVRLLVPDATDLPLVRSVSRAGYRALLEAAAAHGERC